LSAFEGESIIGRLRPAFAELCRVTGAGSSDFELDEFISLTRSVSHEILEIRQQLQDNREELSQLDQYRTHTRSLLVMLSQRVADLKKQTGEAAWLGWAKKVHSLVCGAEFQAEDDIAELRLNIEEGISSLLPRRRSAQEMSPPTRKAARKGVFVMSE
jgi:hypothetical protein